MRDRITVSLAGFKRGSRGFSIEADASSIVRIPPEFQSEIRVNGIVHHLGTKFYLEASLAATATLECDRSLKEFDEEITAEVALEFEMNNELASQQEDELPDGEELRGLFEDAQEIDITEDVRQELFLALPMKRTAPELRDIPFEELHPGLAGGEPDTGGQWDSLKSISKK